MQTEEVIIIGGGPCGLSAAIALQDNGIQALVIEKGNIVNAIYHYPTHQTFFSASGKLEIGEVPFIINERKPTRLQALAYYREVVNRKRIRMNIYEKVIKVTKRQDGRFDIISLKNNQEQHYRAKRVVIATGYYDHPNRLDVPGSDLPKVFHYFKEGHPYYQRDVAVIGGKNSAIDAALELEKSGANVTVLYRGSSYSESIKPWILPEFTALVRTGNIKMIFDAQVTKITTEKITYRKDSQEEELANDFVFAMIGYHPDHSFLKKMGIFIDADTGRPQFDPNSMETNIDGVYIAGVIAAGNNANEIFIENGRFHGRLIAESIVKNGNNNHTNKGDRR